MCAPADGTPRDLAGFARLHASATRSSGIGVAPVESRDAIATVRDDDSDTGWKPPADQAASVTVDWQPFLGRPVRLSSLSLRSSGAPLAKVSVDLLAAPGEKPLRTMHWSDPSTPLDLGGACAGAIVLHVTGGADTVVDALGLETRDASVVVPELAAASVQPPASVHAGSGVVEGYYGVPWSWRERRDLVGTLAEAGLDTYVYAPKSDPLHRAKWREPYPAGDMQHFADLAAFGERLGVHVYVGISPFLDYDPASSDYTTLRDKLAAFEKRGITHFALLADDISPGATGIGSTLANEQLDVANRLVADLAPDKLLFVPTVYNDKQLDAAGANGDAYLGALQALDPAVDVMWTGSDVFADTMSAGDMTRVTALIGRKPLIWDNYWANDATDSVLGRLLLAPLRGRTADLPGAVEGLVYNPAIQGALSRWTIATAADYLDDPAGYDADKARSFAAKLERLHEIPGRDADDTVTFVMRIFDGSGLHTPGDPALASAIGDLDAAIDAGSMPAPGPLLAHLARLSGLSSEVDHSGLGTDAADELELPLVAATAEGDAGLALLAALADKLGGRDATADLALADDAFALAATSRFKFENDSMAALRSRVAALAPTDRGVVAIASGEAPPRCRVGTPWSWTPFAASVAHGAVGGLPGATIDAGQVRFTPPHAGRYTAVAVAWRDKAWGYRHVEIECRGASG